MKIEIVVNGKIVASFEFTIVDNFYAWETIRSFVKTLGKSEYTIEVSYPEEK